MKNIFKYIIPAFLLLAVSCQQDNYEKGTPEDPDCFGVYFPKQTTSTTIEIEPGGALEATYTVRRTKVLEEITVPVNITASEEDIFFVEPIHFAAGEDQTTFTVNFPEAQNGIEYKLDIDITDPHYVSVYGSQSTSLSISLLIASWKSLGIGKWRDDIISSMYSPAHPFVELDVEIFEREDLPGYLRMKPFSTDFIRALFEVTIETQNKWIYVDASNPDAVYFPLQATGMTLSSEQGEIYIASYTDRDFMIDASDCQFGTMTEKVITFPERGIMCRLDKYMEPGEWAYVNNNGKQRIILPGGRVYDYSVAFTKSEPANGVVEMGITLGEDVATMKYAIFSGALSDGDISLNAQALDTGEYAFCPDEITESGKLSLSPASGTGYYTIVACTYDAKGSMQSYGGMPFGYIAEGDSVPVNLTMGIEVTDEYAGLGVNSANSLKFYAYGENIESIEYGLFKTSKIRGMKYDELLDMSGTPMDKEQLEAINAKHYSDMLTGLNGDSEYTMLVRAYNGYVSQIFEMSARTRGKFNPILEDYEYSDFLDFQFTKKDLTNSKWHLYATNLMDDTKMPTRRFIGEVTFEKDDYDDGSAVDYFGMYGFTDRKFTSGGKILAMYLPDANTYYNGTLAMYAGNEPMGDIDGETIFIGFIPIEDISNVYMGIGMFGGKVSDDCIYFVPAKSAQEQGYTFYYLYIGGSKSIIAIYEGMILVRAENDPGLSATSVPTWSTKYAVQPSFDFRRHEVSLADAQQMVKGRWRNGIRNYVVEITTPEAPGFELSDYKNIKK